MKQQGGRGEGTERDDGGDGKMHGRVCSEVLCARGRNRPEPQAGEVHTTRRRTVRKQARCVGARAVHEQSRHTSKHGAHASTVRKQARFTSKDGARASTYGLGWYPAFSISPTTSAARLLRPRSASADARAAYMDAVPATPLSFIAMYLLVLVSLRWFG